MLRTRRNIRNPTGKSKKIKLGERAILQQINDSDTETDEGPNEEQEIDLAVDENDDDDPLRFMPNYGNESPNVDYDHNYITKTVRTLKKHRIMLRQDLFPTPNQIKSDPLQTSQKQVNKSKSVVKRVRIANKKKDDSVVTRNKSSSQQETSKETQPSISLKVDTLTKLNKKIHTIPEIHPTIIEKDDGIMYVHEDLEDLIAPTTLLKNNETACEINSTQDNMLPISKKTQKILKVTSDTSENKKRSGVRQKETIIIDDDSDTPKPQTSSRKPIILKKLQPKEVPEEIKRAKTKPAPTSISETSLKKPKEKFILPKIVPEPNPKTTLDVPHKHNENLSVTNSPKNSQESKTNKGTIIIDDEPASQKKDSPSNQTFVLMKVDPNDVPEEIKKSKILKASPLVLLAPAFVTGTGSPEKQLATILQGEQMFLNTNMTPHLNGNSSGILKVSDISKGTASKIGLASNVLPMLNNSNNRIAGGNSIELISTNGLPVNSNKAAPTDSFMQQTSKTGSTVPRITVMNQGGVLPSTSKTSNNNNDKQTNGMARLWADLDQASSSDDEECEEELGLNSVEELQDLWELVTELYYFNNQTIKSLLTKKRRFQQRIKAVEDLLEEVLGQTQENCESTSDVAVSIETNDLKSQEKHKE